MNTKDMLSLQISARAMDMCKACYDNLNAKGLNDNQNMFFLIAWIAAIVKADMGDIQLDPALIANVKEELEKWGKNV